MTCRVALVFLFACIVPAQAKDLRVDGPLSLVVTYHAAPAQRAGFRKQLETDVVRRFEDAKSEGRLRDYRLLANRYVDSATFDAVAILSFATTADVAAWTTHPSTLPTGLSAEQMSLTTAIDTMPADHERSGAAPDAASVRPVYLVIPYEVLVSTPAYIKYLDGYTIPQLDGWIGEGVLAGYGIYLARYPAGRPWGSLLVLAYRGDEGLAARDSTVAKVRARLSLNPEWKAISDDKKAVRAEKAVVIADEIKPTAHK